MTNTSQDQPQKKKSRKGKVIATGVGLLVLVGFCSTVSSEDEPTVESTNATTTQTATPQSASTAPYLPDPEPDVPREYSNAKKRAESYLKSGHFSYQSLYQQLTSEYGEGFPPDAAQYAMDNIEVDWNKEAVEAAESYLRWSPMSRADLLQQLTSEYGEGFTPEQAEFAVNQVY